MQCKNYTWVTRGTKMRNKNAEQKLRNKKWWGPLDIGCWEPQVQVQKGQWNQNVEQKLVGTLGHRVLGTPSGSAKRSAEQKLVGTLLHLYLGSPLPNVQWSPPIFIPLFLFRIFVLLTFLHLHLRSPTPNVQESPPIFVPLFLFHCFCSAVFVPLSLFCSFFADLFALALGVPATQWPRIPTKFLFCQF